jgi:ABC-type branched-subunit amino acid transport system ATPase component
MTGPSSGPAVAARGLVCQFGPVRAVDDLSFEVAEGRCSGCWDPTGPARRRSSGW